MTKMTSKSGLPRFDFQTPTFTTITLYYYMYDIHIIGMQVRASAVVYQAYNVLVVYFAPYEHANYITAINTFQLLRDHISLVSRARAKLSLFFFLTTFAASDMEMPFDRRNNRINPAESTVGKMSRKFNRDSFFSLIFFFLSFRLFFDDNIHYHTRA